MKHVNNVSCIWWWHILATGQNKNNAVSSLHKHRCLAWNAPADGHCPYFQESFARTLSPHREGPGQGGSEGGRETRGIHIHTRDPSHRIASQLNYLRYVIIMFARAVHICNDNNGRCRCDCLSMSGRCHWCSHVPNKDELVCVKRTTWRNKLKETIRKRIGENQTTLTYLV